MLQLNHPMQLFLAFITSNVSLVSYILDPLACLFLFFLHVLPKLPLRYSVVIVHFVYCGSSADFSLYCWESSCLGLFFLACSGRAKTQIQRGTIFIHKSNVQNFRKYIFLVNKRAKAQKQREKVTNLGVEKPITSDNFSCWISSGGCWISTIQGCWLQLWFAVGQQTCSLPSIISMILTYHSLATKYGI